MRTLLLLLCFKLGFCQISYCFDEYRYLDNGKRLYHLKGEMISSGEYYLLDYGFKDRRYESCHNKRYHGMNTYKTGSYTDFKVKEEMDVYSGRNQSHVFIKPMDLKEGVNVIREKDTLTNISGVAVSGKERTYWVEDGKVIRSSFKCTLHNGGVVSTDSSVYVYTYFNLDEKEIKKRIEGFKPLK